MGLSYEVLRPTSDLVGKQRSDVAEELQLFLQGVAALLRHVHDVKDRRPQVSQSRDGLHLNGVSLLQGVVQDPGGVHHLHTPTHGPYEVLFAFIFLSPVQTVWGGADQHLDPSASYLPAQISVVHVTHKQRLGGESVGLDVHICSGHLARKTVGSHDQEGETLETMPMRIIRPNSHLRRQTNVYRGQFYWKILKDDWWT